MAASEHEVTNCVGGIVNAFTNGLDIFKRLRERRRRKKKGKSGHPGAQTDGRSGEELALSDSLRRGPVDIQVQYERNYGAVGEKFAKGDAIAHASLAETLIKLNTGLVGIIAAFLNHDTRDHLKLDYKGLTNLSNASRLNALGAMDQLYQRLSQSHIALNKTNMGCSRCGSPTHVKCGSKSTSPKKQGRPTAMKSGTSTPMIARVPIKGSNQTQLVMTRPKPGRKSSSSSNSSSSGNSQVAASTVTASPYPSPVSSPLPRYERVDPFPQATAKAAATAAASKARSSSRARANTVPDPRPQKSPLPEPDNSMHPAFRSPRSPMSPSRKPLPQSPPPIPEKIPLGPVSPTTHPASRPVPRRMDKATPSAYSFASDSTKLGEIPMNNWIRPFDFQAAERLNREAAESGFLPSAPAEAKEKPKKKLFGFLRRGSAGEAVS